jgi:hypothetical protein
LSVFHPKLPSSSDDILSDDLALVEAAPMRDIRTMRTVIIRVLLSLLAGSIALVVSFNVIYHFGLEDVASSPYDAQGPMSALFGAAFFAPVIGLLTFALLFGLTLKWR